MQSIQIGDTLFYIERTMKMSASERIMYGEEGTVVNRMQDDSVIMRFITTTRFFNATQTSAYLSRTPPPPLPGGFKAGQALVYSGPSCDLLKFGQKVEVTGRVGRDLAIRVNADTDGVFPCHLTALLSDASTGKSTIKAAKRVAPADDKLLHAVSDAYCGAYCKDSLGAAARELKRKQKAIGQAAKLAMRAEETRRKVIRTNVLKIFENLRQKARASDPNVLAGQRAERHHLRSVAAKSWRLQMKILNKFFTAWKKNSTRGASSLPKKNVFGT